MAKQMDHVVIFPRGTTFVRGPQFYSEPKDVRDYGDAEFFLRSEKEAPASPVPVQYTVQQSEDKKTWVGEMPFSLPLGVVELAYRIGFDRRWARVKAENLLWDPKAECWLEAYFVRREKPAANEGT